MKIDDVCYCTNIWFKWAAGSWHAGVMLLETSPTRFVSEKEIEKIQSWPLNKRNVSICISHCWSDRSSILEGEGQRRHNNNYEKKTWDKDNNAGCAFNNVRGTERKSPICCRGNHTWDKHVPYSLGPTYNPHRTPTPPLYYCKGRSGKSGL